MKKILYSLILFPYLVIGQWKPLLKADKQENKQNYLQAINHEELVVKDCTEEMYNKLANANYLNTSCTEASKYYGKMFKTSTKMTGENPFRFTQTLKSIDHILDAKHCIAEYHAANPSAVRESVSVINSDNSEFTFSKFHLLSLNSSASDYGVTLKNDTLVFASAVNHALDNTTYAQTKQSYTSLFKSVRKTDGTYSKPTLYSKGSYSVYHEATPVFSKDGNTMYYSQNQLENNSKFNLVNGLFKIYKSTFKAGKWNNDGPISFGETKEVRVAHPALSADGKYLYFASDMVGTFGSSDLYKAEIKTDGSFGTPENLGNKINSKGRETYPFITANNLLIFSSDGRSGYGGLDIYYIDLNDPKAEIINIGGVNGEYDDFAMVLNNDMTSGYYTSNRPGGKGDDDIYSFDVAYMKRIVSVVLKGSLKDQATGAVLANALVTLSSTEGNIIDKVISDANGNYNFTDVQANATYVLKAEKDSFLPIEKRVSTGEKDQTELIALEKEKASYKVGDDLAKILGLRIYFDTGKYSIRKDAQVELDKLVRFMKTNSNIEIEIGSHTDSRNDAVKNQALSQKRANATADYLVKMGILNSRIKAVGYGESMQINQCKDGVKCTEQDYQLNRRSEFVITKI